MDPTSPPRRRALAPRAQRHGHLGSDKKSKSESRLLDKNIGCHPKLTERRSTLADAHLPSYLRFLARELRGQDAGSTGRKFLSEAKRRYEVFKVQLLPGQEIDGSFYPPREAFAKTSDWGELAWNYTNNSHRDPLAAELAKAPQIANRNRVKDAERKASGPAGTISVNQVERRAGRKGGE